MPSRIEQERATVEKMIRLYCRRKHGGGSELCDDCQQLLNYARLRLSRCPFGDHKSTCRKCRVHCYSPQMRQRIAQVMRYSGPRLLLVDPVAVIRHMWLEQRKWRHNNDL